MHRMKTIGVRAHVATLLIAFDRRIIDEYCSVIQYEYNRLRGVELVSGAINSNYNTLMYMRR